MAKVYGGFGGFWRFWGRKTKPIQSQFKFYRGERRVRRVKGNMCKCLPNKEIRSTYYFSAVFANSAVNEKTKPILSFRVPRSEFSGKMRKRNLKKQSQFIRIEYCVMRIASR